MKCLTWQWVVYVSCDCFFSNLSLGFQNFTQLTLTWWAWTDSHDLMKAEEEKPVSTCVFRVRLICLHVVYNGNTHCAACHYRHCLQWSRCVAAPRSDVCLCRQPQRAPCTPAAICMDSPSHRKVQSRSEETWRNINPLPSSSARWIIMLLRLT